MTQSDDHWGHKLTVTNADGAFHGSCICGWTCKRSRNRDLRRMFREHSLDMEFAAGLGRFLSKKQTP